MFNNNFFPTPDHTIELMIAPYIHEYTDPKWNETQRYLRGSRDWQILEPSAGKGNIVDYLYEKYKVSKSNIYCIEIEPELQYILQSKGYKVIDSDFLLYNGRYSFDLILMNPPFSEGVKHILKAWSILINGDIVCLLNAETINNPYSKERQLLAEIIKQHGSVEHIGTPFADSERHTNVEVVIVRLKKEKSAIEFDTSLFEKDTNVIDESFTASPLQKADMISSLVDQYDKVVELTLKRKQIEKEYRFYLQAIKSFSEETTKDLNGELNELKELFWQYLFNRTKLGQQITSSFQEDFEKFRQSAINLAFTRDNILQIFDIFMQTKNDTMKKCVWNVFGKATGFHKRNIIWHEGWKSNASYKVNKKIIIPHGGLTYDWMGFSLSYYRQDFFNDMDKSLCWLTGKRIQDIDTVEDVLRKRFEELKEHGGNYREPIFSTFFKIQFWQKGTIHLSFVDNDVWETLNVAVSKNWLGGEDT